MAGKPRFGNFSGNFRCYPTLSNKFKNGDGARAVTKCYGWMTTAESGDDSVDCVQLMQRRRHLLPSAGATRKPRTETASA
jgi:hypothetical protein